MKTLLSLLQETLHQWDAHRVPKMGAALSFYTIFSLAPLAIFVLSLVSLVVERDAARNEIVGQFRKFVGNEGAGMMEMILTKTSTESAGSLGTVLGFVVLLIGASGVFGELQDSLNQIWGVSSKRHPVFIMVKERVFSFAMVFVMGFLMLVSFMFSAFLAAAGTWLHAQLPGLDSSWEYGNDVVSLLVIAILFALIFRLIPDTRQILQSTPATKVLVLTAHADAIFIEQARALGAAGYLTKDTATVLPDAIRAICHGAPFFSPGSSPLRIS